jgi:hypothetical protein
MQLSSQIKPYAWPQPLSVERLLPVSSVQLIFALVLIVLAFVPLVPVDA